MSRGRPKSENSEYAIQRRVVEAIVAEFGHDGAACSRRIKECTPPYDQRHSYNSFRLAVRDVLGIGLAERRAQQDRGAVLFTGGAA